MYVTNQEVIVTIKEIKYSSKWMEFWFDEDFREDEMPPTSFQFSCKSYKFWDLVHKSENLISRTNNQGVQGLKIKLQYTWPNWELAEIIENKEDNKPKLFEAFLATAKQMAEISEKLSLAYSSDKELAKINDEAELLPENEEHSDYYTLLDKGKYLFSEYLNTDKYDVVQELLLDLEVIHNTYPSGSEAEKLIGNIMAYLICVSEAIKPV